jgi:hypothetical protein
MFPHPILAVPILAQGSLGGVRYDGISSPAEKYYICNRRVRLVQRKADGAANAHGCTNQRDQTYNNVSRVVEGVMSGPPPPHLSLSKTE